GDPGDPDGPGDAPLPGEPQAPTGLVDIYASPTGGGAKVGTLESPMTLRSALLRAVNNRVDGRGSRVVLLPGIYRSTLIPEWTDPGASPIVIEAAEAGTAIISGADVWGDWSCSGSTCTHAWPYDWGVASNPWAGDVEIGPLARRRELIVVNGQNLGQVQSMGDLNAATFYVDEGANRVTVQLPFGVDPDEALIEIGVRARLFDSLHWPNVM